MRKSFFILFVFLLITPLFFTIQPVTAIGESWLTTWSYRKSHEIGNSTDAGMGYQIKILVHSGSGSDSGESVYLDSKCEDYPNDIMYTDDDGVTELDHWLKETVGSVTTFWIKINDDLSTVNQSIYIYYGKDGESSQSNGITTFPDFFEDFLGSSLNLTTWDLIQGSPTVSDSVLTSSGSRNVLQTDNVVWDSGQHKSYMSRMSTWTTNRYLWDGMYLDAPAEELRFAMESNTVLSAEWKEAGGGRSYTPILTVNAQQWYDFDVGYDPPIAKWYVDDVLENTKSDLTLEAGMYIRLLTDGTKKWDWIIIRNYVDPEPVNGAWGIEETKPENAITFYNQSNSFFMMNGTKIANGTVTEYPNQTRLELQGIINVSTQFIEWNITTGNIQVNPYNYTVTQNAIIWLIVDGVSGGNGDGETLFLFGSVNAIPINLLFYIMLTILGLTLLLKTQFLGKILSVLLFAFQAIWISGDVLLDTQINYISAYNETTGIYQYANTVTHINTPILSFLIILSIGLALKSAIDVFQMREKRKG